MLAEQRAVAPLRAFLVVLFGLLVVLQTLSLPGQFAHMAEESPELAHLRWPLTAGGAFLLLCAQVVIVATWQLLSRVQEDRIFSEASLVWVDAIVWAVAAAWVGLVGILGYVGVRSDDRAAPLLLLFLASIGVAVIGLLMVVMRALLRKATTLRTDMESVI